MGYVPIFLYLASFTLLFTMVVNASIKNKKKSYQTSLDELINQLRDSGKNFSTTGYSPKGSSLENAENYYKSLQAGANQEQLLSLTHEVKPLMRRTRQRKYWYNNLVQTKPYSFVAWLFGHRPI